MTGSDRELWERALAGDSQAFGLVFDRHYERTRRHAYRLAPTPGDVDDIVAVTFLEAWRKRSAVRFVDDSLLPWLLRTATNVSLNFNRAARRFRTALERLPTAVSPRDPADVVEDRQLISVIRQLSADHQQVLALCVFEDLSIGEAAQVLGVQQGTVASRLSRAKSKLRTLIELQQIREFRVEGATNA